MSIIDKLIELRRRKLEIQREIELAKLDKVCKHEWEVFKEINVYYLPTDKMPSSVGYILRCKHCGELKQFTRNTKDD